MALGKLKERLKKEPSGKEPGGKAKAAAVKPFKASPGPKFVLFIGDEGVILVFIKDNVVQSRQFVPDASEENLSELKNSISKELKAPVMIVVDSMDQSYVQQTLPPVSSLSVKKLIKRRLDRDFGANDIKGAIVLGREAGGRKDWNFLMVSIERSPQLSVWLDFVGELPNRFQGIYLLSVEAEVIIKNLEKSLGVPKEGTGSEWKFFVSHNKVGGFRQVILRNGRIIFTRMAQPVSNATPEVVAGSIEQEMLSTIEYMRRLSFSAQAGLDVYIIASSAIRDVLDKTKFESKNLHVMTPFEVAGHLRIEGATQQTDQFGDVIMAAGIGCSKDHVLTLTTPQSKKFDALFQIVIYQRVLAALSALALLFYSASLAYDIYNEYSHGEELEQKKDAQQKSLDQLKDEIKNSKLDVERTGDLIDLYKQLLQEKITPLPFLARVQNIVRPPVVIKSVEWNLTDEKPTKPVAPPPPPDPSGGNPIIPKQPLPMMQAVLTIQFPGVVSVDAFKVVSKKVLEDMKEGFKGYEIAYTSLPQGYSEEEKLEMTFNNKIDPNANGSSQPVEVKMTIKGMAIASDDMPKVVVPPTPPAINPVAPPAVPLPAQPGAPAGTMPPAAAPTAAPPAAP